jgi:hypothetical protein
MTDRRPPSSDQFLVAWFEDGPTSMPDRVIDVVADRIGRQRQRRPWRHLGRPFMNTYAKLGLAAAAIVVVAVVGYNLLPRTGPGPGGVPSPTPTSEPTVAVTPQPSPIACANGTAGCLGTLAGGTYSTANFTPKLTYTVPAGPGGSAPASFWANSVDLTRSYALVPPGGGYSFEVNSEVAIPLQTPDCSTVQKPGAGNAVADWVTFLTEHPGLEAKAPVAVTIGGFSGFRVDFARAATWAAECSGPVGPVVMLFMHPGHDGVRWTDDQQESIWILDVAGETVLITLDSSPDPVQHTADVASAQPIIDSFVFTP